MQGPVRTLLPPVPAPVFLLGVLCSTRALPLGTLCRENRQAPPLPDYLQKNMLHLQICTAQVTSECAGGLTSRSIPTVRAWMLS